MAGHVRKRTTSSGAARWQARVHTPQGERVRTFDRKGQAVSWISDQTAALSRGEWIDPNAGKVTVGVWAERWYESLTGLRPSTLAGRRSYLDRHVLPVFKDRAVASVSPMDVRRWVAALTDKGLSPEMVRKVHGTLRLVLETAVEDRLIARNPASGIRLPTVEPIDIRLLTPTEIEKLADTIDRRYRELVYVGAYGGLRIGELAGLQRSHVDGATVHVRQGVSEVSGRVDVGPLKTRAARRKVTLPAFVADRLAERLSRLPAGDPLVFPAPEGGPLPRTRFRSRVWIPAINKAGLHGVRVHDLRHTAVSLWIAAGANPKVVATRAGHTSVSVVLNRYGHLWPSDDAMLADRLDELHAPGRPDLRAVPVTVS